MKLSVAMITYNQEKFIGQAIESVLAQRANFDYEIVIGEDCSTDGTRAVIVDFQRRYPQRIVPILRERNMGARNFVETLAACCGQYVAFLEGDDYWTSVDKLQKQVDFLDAHPDRASCCHRIRFLDEMGSTRAVAFPSLPPGPYAIEDLLKGNFVMTGSMVVRRDFIPSFPRWFFRMKMGDWPLWLMVARHGKIELMDEIMAVYRLHPGGTWTSLPPVIQVREVARMLRAIDRHLEFRYKDTIIQTIAAPYLDLALKSRQNGNRVQTAKHLVSCIRNGGLRLGVSPRTFAGLAAYTLVGSSYKIFSRANSTGHS